MCVCVWMDRPVSVCLAVQIGRRNFWLFIHSHSPTAAAAAAAPQCSSAPAAAAARLKQRFVWKAENIW